MTDFKAKIVADTRRTKKKMMCVTWTMFLFRKFSFKFVLNSVDGSSSRYTVGYKWIIIWKHFQVHCEYILQRSLHSKCAQFDLVNCDTEMICIYSARAICRVHWMRASTYTCTYVKSRVNQPNVCIVYIHCHSWLCWYVDAIAHMSISNMYNVYFEFAKFVNIVSDVFDFILLK